MRVGFPARSAMKIAGPRSRAINGSVIISADLKTSTAVGIASKQSAKHTAYDHEKITAFRPARVPVVFMIFA